MNESTFSPSVLIVDDDKPFAEYLRARFHTATSAGVLVANDLRDAREIIDRKEVEIHAIVADLFFDEGRDDQANDLLDGLDVLQYCANQRPNTRRYVMSFYAARGEYVDKARRRNVSVDEWFQKRMYAETDYFDTPWATVERHLLKERLANDPTVATLDDRAVSEFARNVKWPVRTFIQDIRVSLQNSRDVGLKLRKEIRVLCTQESDENNIVSVIANALELGLLASGTGATVEEALDSLKEIIVAQYVQFQGEDQALVQGYAALVRERLEAFIERANP